MRKGHGFFYEKNPLVPVREAVAFVIAQIVFAKASQNKEVDDIPLALKIKTKYVVTFL